MDTFELIQKCVSRLLTRKYPTRDICRFLAVYFPDRHVSNIKPSTDYYAVQRPTSIPYIKPKLKNLKVHPVSISRLKLKTQIPKLQLQQICITETRTLISVLAVTPNCNRDALKIDLVTWGTVSFITKKKEKYEMFASFICEIQLSMNEDRSSYTALLTSLTSLTCCNE